MRGVAARMILCQGQHQPAILQPAAAGEQDRIPYTYGVFSLIKEIILKKG
jgi:hypothetical protein